MQAKIVPFGRTFFTSTNKNSRPLTSKMIVSLLGALEKQKNKIPFGPNTIRGSLTTLITRELIIRKKINLTGHWGSQWQVTQKAIALLKNLKI